MNRRYSPGEVFCNEYVVRLLLGQGGMGEVYLVEHASSGDLRAAKVIRILDTASDADLAGFRKEAHSLLSVGTHPFVVQLFQVLEQARDTVLVMEYVAPVYGCTTVRDYIARTQDYDDRKICMWSVQFCVGMEHALRCGIAAHRDIKPENLLIDHGAFLKISDFGLALPVSQHSATSSNSSNGPSQLQQLKSADGRRVCGTPGYIAPELLAGKKASPQSDIFSFGVTLWQLAARSLASPYGVDFLGDPSDYQNAILSRAVSGVIGHIDSPYFEVIRRCLAPDPAERFSDFSALREAIKSAAKSMNIPVMDFIVAPGLRGSLEDYLNRGRSYIILGRYERALRILDEVVNQKPESLAALTARAEAQIHRGQTMAALRTYEAAHLLDPDADLPLTGSALAWLELGRPAQARAPLDLVLARHPANLNAQLLLARVLSEEKDDQAALDLVEKVIATDPHDWRTHDCHGRVLWRLRNITDAARAFGTCLRINPLALDARLALASLLTSQNELDAAEEEYRHGVHVFQDNAEALNKIAAHMAENGHANKAIELFLTLADIEPRSRSNMLVNIGNAQLRLGDSRSAAESYKSAIEADPDNALAYGRLGNLEYDNGHDEAAAHFTRASELEPQNPTYHASAGTAYLQKQDYKQAAVHLRRSIELFPEQPPILYNLAVAIFADGQGEAAIDELNKAVCVDEGYARGWYLKAEIEARLGRTADSVASARRAVANGSTLSSHEIERLRTLAG